MALQLSGIPKKEDRGAHVEILQQRLLSLHFLQNGADGIFGDGTAAALKKFQSSKNLSATGIIDSNTLRELGLELKTQTDPNPEIAVTDIVDNKNITNTNWANRGKAVWGYYHGMALVFAALYAKLKKGDPIVKEMAKPLHLQSDRDALKKFDDIFAANGMDNKNSEEDRLRHLFVLMFGLGAMESNGRHCEGIDKKENNNEGETTEAGLFQTSYNVRWAVRDVSSTAAEKLSQLFVKYRAANPKGFVQYFAKGFKHFETTNHGTGNAQEFQKLSKECPAFTIAYTAVALRNVTTHWAPVKYKNDPEESLQIKTECNELLKQVQEYVDTYGFSTTEIDLTELAPDVAMPSLAITGENLKEIALNKAGQIGQKEPLQKLFDHYPESTANYWAVVDFNKPSDEERLFIFDLKNRKSEAYLVAHGKNSGERYATHFSNTNGSNQSSLGIYKTAETYIGKHGNSLRIDGKENTNSNARERDIVIHKADYVVPDYEGTGRAGRSEGCFAVNPAYIETVIENLKNGSYLIAWHDDAS